MRDSEVRRAFHETVLKLAHAADDTIVVDELGLKNGIVRADIAVLNGKMIGYEIKTERDTLKRLPAQILAYSEVFDQVFIITSSNHIKRVEAMVPKWWGIFEIVEESECQFSFSCYRKAGKNLSQNTYTLAQLLWKAEALEVVNKFVQSEVTRSASKKEIYKIISSGCPASELSNIVMGYLKKRDNWRVNRSSPL
jgi:hypothetical protein